MDKNSNNRTNFEKCFGEFSFIKKTSPGECMVVKKFKKRKGKIIFYVSVREISLQYILNVLSILFKMKTRLTY